MIYGVDLVSVYWIQGAGFEEGIKLACLQTFIIIVIHQGF